MFAYLSGLVRFKREKFLVVDVNGLGYKVFTPLNLLEAAPLGEPIELHLHTVVREDDISLYGFRDEAGLRLFEQLLTVNGVGPKLAMDLFTWPIDKIKNAIARKEVGSLTQIHGVGKKTAERIVLELSEKVQLSDTLDASTVTAQIHPEVLDALMGLGYQKRDIRQILERQDPALESLKNEPEALIRYFLKHV